jgi:hypothetical protein
MYRHVDELAGVTLALARQVPGGPAREGPGAAFGPARPPRTGDDWRVALALVGRS